MMAKLTRDDLLSLEEYAEQRDMFRQEIMRHKKNRQLQVGSNARLYFEDEKTIRYQIQEILRVEKTFDKEGIEEELEAYNPLIPDGTNFKATFMLEYPDENERKKKVIELYGIEHKVWVQVEDCDQVYAIADEDLERSDGTRTSAVHFLRFELQPAMIAALHNKAKLTIGIDHEAYPINDLEVPQNIADSLVSDLDSVSLN